MKWGSGEGLCEKVTFEVLRLRFIHNFTSGTLPKLQNLLGNTDSKPQEYALCKDNPLILTPNKERFLIRQNELCIQLTFGQGGGKEPQPLQLKNPSIT